MNISKSIQKSVNVKKHTFTWITAPAAVQSCLIAIFQSIGTMQYYNIQSVCIAKTSNIVFDLSLKIIFIYLSFDSNSHHQFVSIPGFYHTDNIKNLMSDYYTLEHQPSSSSRPNGIVREPLIMSFRYDNENCRKSLPLFESPTRLNIAKYL